MRLQSSRSCRLVALLQFFAILLVQQPILFANASIIRRQTTAEGKAVVLEGIKYTPESGDLYKRRGLIFETEIGTPPQKLDLRLSGNPLTFVVSDPGKKIKCSSADTTEVRTQCEIRKNYGTFNRENSSTWKDTQVAYGGSYDGPLIGEIVSDLISLPGLSLENFEFIEAEGYNSMAQLGIGSRPGEENILNTSTEGRSLLQTLFDRGIIPVKGYALYYDSFERNSSQITFGTVDRDKYELPMVTYKTPSQNKADATTNLNLEVTAFSLKVDDKETASYPLQPVQSQVPGETGLSTQIMPSDPRIGLPKLFLVKILAAIGAKSIAINGTGGAHSVLCSKIPKLENVSFVFHFQGLDIELKPKDFIEPFLGATPPPTDQRCEVMLEESDSKGGPEYFVGTQVTLGIPFLRVAYVWVDILNGMAGLARAKQGVTTSNLVAMKPGGIIETLGDQSVTKSKAPVIGGAVGGAVGGIIALGIIGYLIFWFKRRRRIPSLPPAPPMGQLQNTPESEIDGIGLKAEVNGSMTFARELEDADQRNYYEEMIADSRHPVELPGGPVFGQRAA